MELYEPEESSKILLEEEETTGSGSEETESLVIGIVALFIGTNKNATEESELSRESRELVK